MKLTQLQEEISKTSLPVSAVLSNDFKSIILETDERKISPFMRLFWEEQQKYLQSSQNNATYLPMNPDTDVTHQTVNLFSSDKCFIYFVSDVPHSIHIIHIWYTFDTWYIWSNDIFVLWNCIFAMIYEDRECCLQILPKQQTFVH